MNAKINTLKQALEVAHTAYVAEQARLTDLGLNSKARYEALKPLKTAEDAANKAYVSAAHGAIRKELNTIIAADAPRARAEKLARSPWKAAKAAASI